MNEPMHVYRMQKLFEAQGKDRVVNVRARASLYQTREGRLTWTEQWPHEIAARFTPTNDHQEAEDS
jgi:hypothetical protein